MNPLIAVAYGETYLNAWFWPMNLFGLLGQVKQPPLNRHRRYTSLSEDGLVKTLTMIQGRPSG
jgi:hypothetical protein